jgi:UDP-GlcNAc:undecaprenyl-phosphate/decaprenyl-phosphate GlcNAc-1-phosphate transferase
LILSASASFAQEVPVFSYLMAFGTALFASLFVTRIVREWAKRKGWVDKPDGKRKLHDHPIPRIGGLGIYLALIIGLVPIAFVHTAVADYMLRNHRALAFVLALSGLMMLVGLWDDLQDVAAWKRFAVQSLVALLCWMAGFRILEVWAGDHIHLWWMLSLPLTILWIVGITNAFNLIDGMDGLAAGAALFATLSMLVVSVIGDFALSALVLSAIAGAILGFLRYNFNPASIFLGDSGSYLLGFLLSLLAIKGSQKSTAAFAIAVPIVALGLPMLDTGLAIARRFVRGKSIFSGDRRHIHHLLINRGLEPRRAVILLYGISGLFGLFSLCFINPSEKTNGVFLAILGVCIWLGIQKLRYSELNGLKCYFSKGLQNQRKLLAGSVVVGQIIEEMQKAKTLYDLVHAIGSGLEELCFSRFEFAILSDKANISMGSDKQWEMIPLATGGIFLRWTSPCRNCEKIREKRGSDILDVNISSTNTNEYPCDNCEGAKNPILQKNSSMRLGHLSVSSIENEILFPLCNRDGFAVGHIKYYHPAGDEYPVSAIAILSQNIGKEAEMGLQRILCNEISSGRYKDEANLELMIPHVSDKKEQQAIQNA